MKSNFYTLSEPLQQVLSGAHHGPTTIKAITRVEVREATGKDLLLVDKLRDRPVELALELIAALSSLTHAQVRRLGATDLAALYRIIEPSIRQALSLGAGKPTI